MAKSPAGAADFVAKIVKDPKDPPQTLMLTGFIGASSEEGHTRLYFDAHLSSYVEIPNDAILHVEPAGTEGLGASHVWIKRDAVLVYGPAGSQRPKGTFLEGPIMQDHLGAAAAAGAAQYLHTPDCWQRQAAPRSDFVACNTLICPPSPHCPQSDFVACNSWICPPTPHCPKSDFVPCQSWICPPTQPHLCMTAHCTVPPQCPHPTAPQVCLLSAPPHCPTVAPICPPHTVAPVCVSVPPHCPYPTVPPMCPLLSAPPNCPTVGACPSIACQSIACQPGGGVAAPQVHALMAAAPPAAAAPASMICATAIACPTLPVNCGIVPPSLHGPCLTAQPNCVSVFIPCQTRYQPLCQPHLSVVGCPPSVPCPTHNFSCQSQHHPLCPSVVAICPTQVCNAQI